MNIIKDISIRTLFGFEDRGKIINRSSLYIHLRRKPLSYLNNENYNFNAKFVKLFWVTFSELNYFINKIIYCVSQKSAHIFLTKAVEKCALTFDSFSKFPFVFSLPVLLILNDLYKSNV